MPRREKKPKLTARQKRERIEDYGIEFKGPVAPSKWPKEFKEIFRTIRNIDRMRFDEYRSSESREFLEVAEKKDRVRSLIRVAASDRRQRVNEATWRQDAEHLVVSRFAAEVICRTCRSRLWKSEFLALPTDPAEATQLQRRRAERRLCNCDDESRAKEDIDDASEMFMFSNRAEHCVIHDPDEKLSEHEPPLKRPDRVFGLEMTKSFNIYTSRRREMRHSPFEDGLVLYPFLIIEARSEKGSQGFEAIETQTAFPIRTCLKLQDDLRKVSKVDLNPLVWFLANQGDEWRVSAGIIEDSKFQVFDLWMGRILSQDGALQLLHIIDFICDWARDIYRVNILRCLAGGASHLRDWTPAYTVRSTTPNEVVTRRNSQSLAIPLRQLQSIEDVTNEDEVMEDSPAASDKSELQRSANSNDKHPMLWWLNGNPDPNHWSNLATVRHANLVLFTFRHISIPEDGVLLVKSIQASGGKEHAETLLNLFREGARAVKTTRRAISQLEDEWVKRNDTIDVNRDRPVRAYLEFRTYIRAADWQIVRELCCISCSPRAAAELANIVGAANLNFDIAANLDTHLPLLVRPLRSLYGVDSATAAVRRFSLCLESSQGENAGPEFLWVNLQEPTASYIKFWADVSIASSFRNENRHHFGPRPGVSKMSELVPGKRVMPWLRALLDVHTHRGYKGAILLRKASWWPATTPIYCLLVFKGIDISNEPELARTLALIKEFSIPDPDEHEQMLGANGHTPMDVKFLTWWTNSLLGKTADGANRDFS